jgi:hypothetical protein
MDLSRNLLASEILRTVLRGSRHQTKLPDQLPSIWWNLHKSQNPLPIQREAAKAIGLPTRAGNHNPPVTWGSLHLRAESPALGDLIRKMFFARTRDNEHVTPRYVGNQDHPARVIRIFQCGARQLASLRAIADYLLSVKLEGPRPFAGLAEFACELVCLHECALGLSSYVQSFRGVPCFHASVSLAKLGFPPQGYFQSSQSDSSHLR